VLVLSNGRFTAEVDVDVPRVISDPGFVELREQLLEAIA
jgi:hypothetical protein